jgi:ABC-type phosphonate transport system ATPase subunit
MKGRMTPNIAVGAAVSESGVGSDLRLALLSRRLTLQEETNDYGECARKRLSVFDRLSEERERTPRRSLAPHLVR